MCGRLACYLSGEALCESCSYKRNESVVKPTFMESLSRLYVPNYNIYPTLHVPVLVAGSEVESKSELAIVSMRWNLIPPYMSSNFTTVTHTHNARSNSLQSSKIFSDEMKKCHRCVILCNGFYEWKRQGKDSQPYYFYPDKSDSPWLGESVVKLAGVYSKNKDATNDEIRYSCAVITREADSNFSWIHHRMPTVLTTTEDVEKWLFKEQLGVEDSYKFIQDDKDSTKFQLSYHSVGKEQLKPSENSPKCIERVALKRTNTLDNWISKKPSNSKS